VLKNRGREWFHFCAVKIHLKESRTVYSKHHIVNLGLLLPMTAFFKKKQEMKLFKDPQNLCLINKCKTFISPESATRSHNLYSVVDGSQNKSAYIILKNQNFRV